MVAHTLEKRDPHATHGPLVLGIELKVVVHDVPVSDANDVATHRSGGRDDIGDGRLAFGGDAPSWHV